jgi:biotin operon repressor
MLEIVHDMAPGATLGFATALNSRFAMAQNIQSLRNAGCNVIVDDIGY